MITQSSNEINLMAYSKNEVILEYLLDEALQPAEAFILNRIHSGISGKKILDIGVGTGRTIRPLLAISNNYSGLDYSGAMIEACQKRFPSVVLSQGDARDLSLYPDNETGLVFFSFNGLDYMSHVDRLHTLKGIYRILVPEGYFVFSSHNRNYIEPAPISKHPGLLFKQKYKQLRKAWRRFKNRRFTAQAAEYEIFWDETHGGLVTYSIGIDEQIKQLAQAGFRQAPIAVNQQGQIIEQDTQSPWIYYCVQKGPSSRDGAQSL
ncbi:class I SAM-dependent methyltransferase [Vampirovibrio sp.]|uniref:class I SAM-dependent methyltransferase n=1 Tax=Vampirovibrio sp. TaxID=2717857 RepID=UPI0035931EF2